MSVLVQCPQCQCELRFPAAVPVGRTIGCPACGHRFSAESLTQKSTEQPSETAPKSPSTKSSIYKILILCSIIFIITVGVVIWSRYDLTPTQNPTDPLSFIPENCQILIQGNAQALLQDVELQQLFLNAFPGPDGIPVLTRLSTWGITIDRLREYQIAVVREPEMKSWAQQSVVYLSWIGADFKVEQSRELSRSRRGRIGRYRVFEVEGTNIIFLDGNTLIASGSLPLLSKTLLQPMQAEALPQHWHEHLHINGREQDLRGCILIDYLRERGSHAVYGEGLRFILPTLLGLQEGLFSGKRGESEIDFNWQATMESAESAAKRCAQIQGFVANFDRPTRVMTRMVFGKEIVEILEIIIPSIKVDQVQERFTIRGKIPNQSLPQVLQHLMRRQTMPTLPLPLNRPGVEYKDLRLPPSDL